MQAGTTPVQVITQCWSVFKHDAAAGMRRQIERLSAATGAATHWVCSVTQPRQRAARPTEVSVECFRSNPSSRQCLLASCPVALNNNLPALTKPSFADVSNSLVAHGTVAHQNDCLVREPIPITHTYIMSA
jgi:uncharacterized protein (DUF2235 family)